MNKPTDNNVPQPLTEAEEAEMRQLWRDIYGDSLFAIIEETTPQTRRYDELMSKKLTYMQYQYDLQVKHERKAMRLN